MSKELRDILLKEDRKELNKAANRIAKSKREKTIIFTAHTLAEKLVSDMIATRLVQPHEWLDDADYLSKIKLAKALGILGQKEYSICRVLALARSAFKSANSLPQKCKTEILRIAYAHFKREPPRIGSHTPFEEVVRVLLAILSARWLEVRFKKKVYDLRRRYRHRWSSLMKKTLWANLDLLALDADSPENQRAVEQVDIELVKRLRAEKKL